MTLAVTGATGFVGRALLDEAARQHVDIRALTRRVQPKTKGIEWVPGDLHDRKALMRLVRNAEAVIHVAGVVNSPDPTGFHLGNVEGTLALVEAAMAAGVPRIVFVSSLAAREPKLSKYGASKAHAERSSRPAGSTGPSSAPRRSTARATERCSTCFAPRAGACCRCLRQGGSR